MKLAIAVLVLLLGLILVLSWDGADEASRRVASSSDAVRAAPPGAGVAAHAEQPAFRSDVSEAIRAGTVRKYVR